MTSESKSNEPCNNFLQELGQLNESNVIRQTGQIRKYTAKDISELAFIHILVLFIMLDEFGYEAAGVGHAAHTMKYGGFKRFNTASTDLYVYLHILSGFDTEFLKDQTASKLFLKNMHLNMNAIKNRLREISYGKRNKAGEGGFLMNLEKQLKISNGNLKSCRRIISSWADMDEREKRLVVTRLLQALRMRTPNADILVHLEKIAKDRSYEDALVLNPESKNADKAALLKKTKELIKKNGYDVKTAMKHALTDILKEDPRKKK
ncbi:hypothetical protein FDI40_gp064 [Agrobacterium phage Atu_ph07]|uniref:Uncharacterized protein n=1 Tax=Agrobacterium phage Atu_ph07 TaxID=2024264 RepID=A0A2L0UZB0_9CAUD|nr:hypothetical protein FDI40_gp064 [Agrobacterium phage Atu_ph07]AUZ94876.1 hypothetical protein [Agrobacterium phage Atu_ph07]